MIPGLKIGDLRYQAKILRPSKTPSAGGREGQPEVIVESWPCSNEATNGREMNIARQMVPLVTHLLKGWKPSQEVKAQDYAEIDGKRLNIEFADPLQENGRVLMLVCIEQAI